MKGWTLFQHRFSQQKKETRLSEEMLIGKKFLFCLFSFSSFCINVVRVFRTDDGKRSTRILFINEFIIDASAL